jgi:hypothetical protein
MERFHQGYLHPNLEVPGLGGDHSRKEPFEELLGTSTYEPATLHKLGR